MPKIYLRGEKEPVVVSKEDADRILEQKNDASFKGMIDVGPHRVSKGVVKEILYSDENESKRFNLDIPADRQMIRDFETFLEKLKTEIQSDQPIEYYGSPITSDKYPGYVVNELLGGVHWTAVEYALQNKIVSRNTGPYTSWAIYTGPWEEFRAKIDTLTELRGRRQYAERQEREGQVQTIVQERVALRESKRMPYKDDEEIELPF